MQPDIRRVRIAATVAFATNGALPATLLARYAEVKELLGVGTAAFGVIVVAAAIGAGGAFNLPGILLRRFGSHVVTTLGTLWIAVVLVIAALGAEHGAVWLFVAGLALAGFGDANVDVAQNAQGLRVQGAYGSSVLSSMHAGWSIGAAIGGAVGTVAATLGVPLGMHVAAWGVVCVAAMFLAGRAFLPDRVVPGSDGESAAGPLGRRTILLLAPLVLVAVAGISVEDIGNNWSAVLLATERQVPVESSGIALSVLLGAQFVGRLLGDRVINRMGDRVALIGSLALVTSGLVVAAWAPWAWLTVAGLAVAGFGSAVTVPLAFARADALPGLRAHAGVTWVGWAMRLAAITLSPAIGVVGSLASLPVAISAMALLAAGALVLQVRARA